MSDISGTVTKGVSTGAKIMRYLAIGFGLLFLIGTILCAVFYSIEKNKKDKNVKPGWLLFGAIVCGIMFIICMIALLISFLIHAAAPLAGSMAKTGETVAPMMLM